MIKGILPPGIEQKCNDSYGILAIEIGEVLLKGNLIDSEVTPD